jgi:hypothetical protein
MGLHKDEVEIIIIDDGSNPPLDVPDYDMPNFLIVYTNDKRPWTQGLARNYGAKHARGEYLMMTDIDHIFTRKAIDVVLSFDGDKMNFPRFYGALDENGVLLTAKEDLWIYGLDPNRIRGRRGMCAGHHGNTFAIRKKIFEEMGGYQEKHCIGMMHQGVGKGEDIYFYSAYHRCGKYKPMVSGPRIYMFPTGRFHVKGETNPMGLFHGLSYELVKQPMLP